MPLSSMAFLISRRFIIISINAATVPQIIIIESDNDTRGYSPKTIGVGDDIEIALVSNTYISLFV